LNADGTGVTRLTNDPLRDAEPAWSPDGTKIAFTSNRDGNHEIYVLNADGTGVTRLTNDPLRDAEPAWSPDGTKIAFSRSGYLGPEILVEQIYVMNADGSGAKGLTTNGWGPSWRPQPAPEGASATRRSPSPHRRS
jgi:Tol biopolymer transport system component